ncbi:MAG: MFS transporter [Promethearchaeota archaeon]
MNIDSEDFESEKLINDPEKSAKIFVFVLLIGNFFRNLGSSIVQVGLPAFILSLSGTLTSYGLVISIFSLTQAIFQLPMAFSSDKYGRRKIILLGFSIYITGTFLCFYAQTFIQLIIFRAIQGAGAYSSILQAMIGDYYRKEEHGKGMAYYSFSLSLGFLGGIVLGGYISYYFGFRVVFLFSGILTIISAVLILVFFKDLRTMNHNGNNVNNQIEKVKASDLKFLLKINQFRMVIVLNCIRWLIFGGIVAYIVWILEMHWGLSEIETSYVLVFIVGIYISFVLFSGKLVDRFDSKSIILTGQVLIMSMGVLVFFVVITNSLAIFLIAAIISGIGLAIYQTAGNTQLLRIINKSHPELKGSGFGFNNSVGFLCSSIGPVLICYIGEISLFYSFYFISLIVLVVFVLTLKFLEK